MTDEELEHIHSLTDKRGEALLLRTTVTGPGSGAEVRHVLLAGRSLGEPGFGEETEA
jgi:hypothetical protein